MGYYKNYYSDSDVAKLNLTLISIFIAILVLLVIGTNSCSASDWNDGICPKCETRYELRGASKGLKYYACPDCGKEVQRY